MAGTLVLRYENLPVEGITPGQPVERKQPVQERQRPGHVDRVRVEQPLHLSPSEAAMTSAAASRRVDVGRDPARPLPGLDPGRQRVRSDRNRPRTNSRVKRVLLL